MFSYVTSKAFVVSQKGTIFLSSHLPIHGFPSVKMSTRFWASGLSPPSGVNSLLRATLRTRSVRVPTLPGTTLNSLLTFSLSAFFKVCLNWGVRSKSGNCKMISFGRDALLVHQRLNQIDQLITVAVLHALRYVTNNGDVHYLVKTFIYLWVKMREIGVLTPATNARLWWINKCWQFLALRQTRQTCRSCNWPENN